MKVRNNVHIGEEIKKILYDRGIPVVLLQNA